MTAHDFVPPVPAAPQPVAVTCSNCRACCCKLEVMLLGGDDVPARFMLEDAWGGWIMRRRDDGWCAALDRDTHRCTIYARRPQICRDFATGSDECLTERRQLGAPAPVPETHTVIALSGLRSRPAT